jgi:hypothetical protein
MNVAILSSGWGSNLALHRIIGEDILNIAGYLRGNKKLSFIDFEYNLG